MNVFWFLEEHLDEEYQTYRVLAWRTAAELSFKNWTLEPYFSEAIAITKAANQLLHIDTIHPYMYSTYTEHELYLRMEQVDKQSPEWEDVKSYVAKLISEFNYCRQLGNLLLHKVEQNTSFKGPSRPKTIYLRMSGSNVYQLFTLSGERISAIGTTDVFSNNSEDLLVETQMAFPSEDTMVPVIERYLQNKRLQDAHGKTLT